MLVAEVSKHVKEDIIPYWMNLKDEQYGGFFGYVGYDMSVNKMAEKGGILNSRILWFFSNAYLTLKDEKSLECAKHAYDFLKNHCYDKEYGGVFWSVTYDGKPEDDSKHTYNQAFAVYALSSYYDASGDREALELAYQIYRIIEEKCTDEIGYMEAFNRKFELVDNEKLSENGLIASKTYNTLLHVFEAYTELYRVTKDNEVGNRLKWIVDQFATVLYNPDRRIMEVFFDANMKTISDLHSFGHDIETTWLLDRGVDILGDQEYIDKIRPVTKELADCILEVAFDGQSLDNEKFHGEVDTTKIWWAQAEAVVGFINAYEKMPEKKEYLETAKTIWEFIKKYLINKEAGSEWNWDVDANGVPKSKREFVGIWKCPYHNGRMCFELINRGIN